MNINPNIECAIRRLEKALKYGNDMRDSKLLCIEDAIALLQTAANGVYIIDTEWKNSHLKFNTSKLI